MSKIKNGKNFSNLLSNAHVKGLIDEVVLKIEGGVGIIQAIDMTSSVFLSCEEEIDIDDDLELGINNLPMLIKFFDNSTNVNYSIKKQWITLKKKKSQLKCILSDIDAVTTSINDKLELDDLKKQCKNSLTFDKVMFDELTYYVNLVSPSSVYIESKKGKALLRSNEYDEQQFKIKLSKTKKKIDCKVEVLADHFIKVLSTLDWGKKVKLYFGTGVPTIIKQDNNFWALVPLMDNNS